MKRLIDLIFRKPKKIINLIELIHYHQPHANNHRVYIYNVRGKYKCTPQNQSTHSLLIIIYNKEVQ